VRIKGTDLKHQIFAYIGHTQKQSQTYKDREATEKAAEGQI
jgi:hypothetical protein